ncbi:odorant receptor 13a-like isoform X1 [Microplitis mediator]|uniref:odorant receptor 13a-like isoform X1 n=2 Tax=Microplitis mediator TaxID=375433 RepID=UPI002555E320|nr:odorant receptor 13a-like isoform X1 [Microplitis mediator]
MDYLSSPYCRLNKILLSCLGEWPYQTSTQRRFIRSIIYFFSASIIIPKIIKLIKVWGNLDMIIECIPMLLLDAVNFVKVVNGFINFRKMRELFDRIQDDWGLDYSKREFEIMHNYAEDGKKLSQFYASYMYATMLIYFCMPIIPKALDIVLPLNTTRPELYLFEAEYFIDQQKFYYPILIHAYITCAVAVSMLVAFDTEYAIQALHGSGIFSALRYKLENLVIKDDEADYKNDEKIKQSTYNMVVQCAILHKRALDYADLLESSRVTCFFFVLLVNIAAISITGVQTVMKLDQPTEAIRFGVYTLAQITHIFYNSYPAQMLFDNSWKTSDAIFAGNWYRAGSKSKNLLHMMIIRSRIPCKLTAGKIYLMSLENFTGVVKTSMSYFTVLLSFR